MFSSFIYNREEGVVFVLSSKNLEIVINNMLYRGVSCRQDSQSAI